MAAQILLLVKKPSHLFWLVVLDHLSEHPLIYVWFVCRLILPCLQRNAETTPVSLMLLQELFQKRVSLDCGLVLSQLFQELSHWMLPWWFPTRLLKRSYQQALANLLATSVSNSKPQWSRPSAQPAPPSPSTTLKRKCKNKNQTPTAQCPTKTSLKASPKPWQEKAWQAYGRVYPLTTSEWVPTPSSLSCLSNGTRNY